MKDNNRILTFDCPYCLQKVMRFNFGQVAPQGNVQCTECKKTVDIRDYVEADMKVWFLYVTKHG